MKFEQILIATLDNSNEIREQAEFTINQYKEIDYQHFLVKITKQILKTNNPISFYISFTIILQDIRSGKLFADQEIFDFFLPIFQDVLSQIFTMQKLDDATCNILSTILTKISIEYPSANIDQFLISSVDEVTELQSFFINTLSTILFHSTNNNTPFDVFTSILSIPNSTYIDYNSKFFLAFSIIEHFPKNADEMHSIISQYISNIPDESVQYVLFLFSRYFKRLKLFFEDFYEDIFTFITSCIENCQDDFSIQAEAIDCLTNIAITYKCSDEIISNILFVILQMIENNKDNEIESILKESIQIMSCNISSWNFLSALANIHDEEKLHFSYLIAISELHPNACDQLMLHTVDYFAQISTILEDSTIENFFNVKIAALLAIENLCTISGPSFQEDNFDELFSLLCQELTTETDMSSMILILRCLSIFLSKVNIELNDDIASLFSFLIQIFFGSDEEELMAETINVIRYLARSLSSSFLQFYPSLIQMISQIDFSDQPELLVPTIRLCDVCVSKIRKIIQSSDQISIQNLNEDDTLISLFQYSVDILSKVENENDFDYVSHAIISFIKFFGSKIFEFLISHVIPLFLNYSASEIEITHLPEDHGVESIPGFVCVSPCDFAKLSTIRSIIFALLTIECCISVLKSDYRPFTEPTLEVVSNWITYEFEIAEIKELSWAILDRLNKSDNGIDINVTFSLFLNDPLKEINSESSVSVLLSALSIGADRENIDTDILIKVFESFIESLQQKLQNVADNQGEIFDHDDDDDDDADEGEIDDDDEGEFVANETSFLKLCLKKLSDIAVAVFQQEVVPLLPQMIEYRPFFSFVIKVTTCYIIISHDLSFFDDFQVFLFDSFSDIESKEAQISMKSIGKFFEQSEVHFPLNFYLLSYDKMASLLEDHVSYENDSLLFYNATIISFTKLIANHSDILDDITEIDLENGLVVWFESIQHLLSNRKNLIVFDFLAYLIHEKTEDALEIFGPSPLILLILDNLGNEAVSEENKDLFISFIKQYFSTQGSPFDENELDEYRQSKLKKILQSD